jgi:MFS family permease
MIQLRVRIEGGEAEHVTRIARAAPVDLAGKTAGAPLRSMDAAAASHAQTHVRCSHIHRGVAVREPSGMRLALTGMLTLAVAIGIGRFAFTPILPVMQKDLGLSLRAAGLLASANYIGYFLGALSAIWLRLSPRIVVRGSVLAIVILTVAMGITEAPAAWLVLRALAGIASAWALIFASAWILQVLAERNEGALGGVVFGGVGAGIALTGVLCVGFLRLGWTADRMWIAMGLVALLPALFIWRICAFAPSQRAAAPAAAPVQSSLRSAANLRLIWSYGSFGFGYIIPATFLPAMARRIIADPAVFGWAWPIFGTAALLSVLLAGRLSSRYSYRSIWLASQLIMMAGVVIPVVWHGIGGIVASALCVGGTFVVATMAGVQEGRRVAAGNATSLIAAMTTAFAIGQILGPLVVSAAADRAWGMDAALLSAGVVLLAGAASLSRGR